MNCSQRLDTQKISYENILFHLNFLQSNHETFLDFIEEVRDDIERKRSVFNELQESNHSNVDQKINAVIHQAILKLFDKRISSMKKAACNALAHIYTEFCDKQLEDVKIMNLKEKQLISLEKMKRRLKHMMDVSEKYAISEDCFREL